MDAHTDVEKTAWKKICEHLHAKAQTLNEELQIRVPSYDARCYSFSAVRNAPPKAEVHLNFSAPNPCLFVSFESGGGMTSGMFRVEQDGRLVCSMNDAESSPEALADEVLNYLKNR